MTKGKAFFVVGHKNWGKSMTLRALTNDNPHYRYWKIKGREFLVRRMSDDDVPKAYEQFANWLQPAETPLVLAALCPRLIDEKWRPLLRSILDTLERKYDLFFFVLKNKGNDPTSTISQNEIDPFGAYGTVKVHRIAGSTPEVRAKALESFIKQYT